MTRRNCINRQNKKSYKTSSKAVQLLLYIADGLGVNLRSAENGDLTVAAAR